MRNSQEANDKRFRRGKSVQELRVKGWTFQMIANFMNISNSRAQQLLAHYKRDIASQ